mmetsp:Transcript_42998/g.113302  ORF Transcript_42998/g.113302 Transcript_42998/m.113302 type:complete len:206 (-) Transcript_42998:76-693(-)
MGNSSGCSTCCAEVRTQVPMLCGHEDDFLNIPEAGSDTVCAPRSTSRRSTVDVSLEQFLAIAGRPSVPGLGGSSGSLHSSQNVVRVFVRNLKRGRKINVLGFDGERTSCIVSLNRSLTVLRITPETSEEDKAHSVALADVTEICLGTDVDDDIPVPVDDLCVTIKEKGQQLVVLRFDEVEDRSNFALCLSVFVDGRRGVSSSTSA